MSSEANDRSEKDARAVARNRFLADSRWADWAVEALPADASFRRYFRLKIGAQSVLLMDAPPETEDLASFLAVDGYLQAAGLRAPKIYAEDLANGFAVMEDFGDSTYTTLLDAGAEPEPLYSLAVQVLSRLHKTIDAHDLELPRYDDGNYEREISLFADWYWVARTGAPMRAKQREEYDSIWRELLKGVSTERECLVLRDYHVDNLMRIEGSGTDGCGLLDFQDARIGSRAYDLVSLFEDARRDVDMDMAKRLVSGYLDNHSELNRDAFAYDYRVLGAHRHAKILGIFVRLCVRDGKQHYLNYLPRVQRLFERSLEDDRLRSLADWLGAHHPGAVTEPLEVPPRSAFPSA